MRQEAGGRRQEGFKVFSYFPIITLFLTTYLPELGERFWQNAQVVKPIPKTAISIRLDNDVLDWFKTQGKGYQTLINAVLRSYVNHQQNQ